MIFRVEVSLPGGGSTEIEVMAASEDDAEEIVNEMISDHRFEVQAVSDERMAA